jgi:NodT family efflux transporter outer membrane factor (OMF) lipoprotein
MLISCLYLVGLAGCAVGPDFQAPKIELSDRWQGAPSGGSPQASPAAEELAAWWRRFNDPILSSLEERAVRSNLDLKLAAARVRQARAALGVARGALGPNLDATASYTRSRSAPVASSGSAIEIEGTESNLYKAGFDAGWEIDIFGGARRNVEAARADLEAGEEARRDALVTLTAEVARNYAELRTSQQRAAIARQNLAAQEHSTRLTRQRFEGGFASGLDVVNAQGQMATTTAQIPLLESAARQSIYALSILLGLEPGALVEELAPWGQIPPAPPLPPLGVPSDLLRRRPDIRRAEAQIHAATARIGEATADLFPKFTLSGVIGVQSADVDTWFNWSRRIWSFGPSLQWRLFDSGRTWADIEQKEALQEQSLIVYRQTVLASLRETENALVALSAEQERHAALIKAVEANLKAVELAKLLYTEGQTDFLNVLEAQRSLLLDEDALVQNTGKLSLEMIALFKALGGGWSEI